MYKLVAIDCDHTLLDSTAHIPQENKRVISLLKEKGINFILATGRNDILVKDYVKELGIDAPVIGCNGGSLRNLLTNRLYMLNPLTKPCIKAVFDYCSEREIKIRAFSMTHGYSNEKNAFSPNLNTIVKTYTKVLSEKLIYEIVEDMYSLTDGEPLLKLVIVNDDFKFIEKTQNELKTIDGIEVVRSNNGCLDIVNKGASKGCALKAYTEDLGFKPEEIVAFGDSENDLSMFETAGFSVAMGNAEKILKDAASMVTLTNDEAGVAYALKKIFSI